MSEEGRVFFQSLQGAFGEMDDNAFNEVWREYWSNNMDNRSRMGRVSEDRATTGEEGTHDEDEAPCFIDIGHV